MRPGTVEKLAWAMRESDAPGMARYGLPALPRHSYILVRRSYVAGSREKVRPGTVEKLAWAMRESDALTGMCGINRECNPLLHQLKHR